mmetsp:Transcript_53198/g.110957  ORF Transcript_53198/g.110957 Transcript_53198/m.110957 type:complete len:125 (-) Transcript_53198:302-676(-)
MQQEGSSYSSSKSELGVEVLWFFSWGDADFFSSTLPRPCCDSKSGSNQHNPCLTSNDGNPAARTAMHGVGGILIAKPETKQILFGDGSSLELPAKYFIICGRVMCGTQGRAHIVCFRDCFQLAG